MNSEKEQNLKQEGWWMTLLVVIPAIFLSSFSDLFVNEGFMGIVISGILGGIGAMIGAILYYFTKEKSTPFRMFVFLSLILALLFLALFNPLS